MNLLGAWIRLEDMKDHVHGEIVQALRKKLLGEVWYGKLSKAEQERVQEETAAYLAQAYVCLVGTDGGGENQEIAYKVRQVGCQNFGEDYFDQLCVEKSSDMGWKRVEP